MAHYVGETISPATFLDKHCTVFERCSFLDGWGEHVTTRNHDSFAFTYGVVPLNIPAVDFLSFKRCTFPPGWHDGLSAVKRIVFLGPSLPESYPEGPVLDFRFISAQTVAAIVDRSPRNKITFDSCGFTRADICAIYGAAFRRGVEVDSGGHDNSHRLLAEDMERVAAFYGLRSFFGKTRVVPQCDGDGAIGSRVLSYLV